MFDRHVLKTKSTQEILYEIFNGSIQDYTLTNNPDHIWNEYVLLIISNMHTWTSAIYKIKFDIKPYVQLRPKEIHHHEAREIHKLIIMCD